MSGSSSTIKTRSMTDVLPPDQENDHLGDVRRMVPNTFEVLGYEDHLQRPRDVLRVFHHVGEQLTKNLLVAVVDKGVVLDHLLGQRSIRIDKGIQAILENPLRGL